MNKTLMFAIMIFLLLPIVNAQVITIGCSPSEFLLGGSGDTCVEMNFFNTHGEVDAEYTLKLDECMESYVQSYPETFVVPKGTDMSNPVTKQMCLSGNFNEEKLCYVYVYGKPVGAEEEENKAVRIERRIGVKFLMGTTVPTTSTTSTSVSTSTSTTSTSTIETTTIEETSHSSSPSPKTTPKTTTTTKTTPKTTTTTKTTTKTRTKITPPKPSEGLTTTIQEEMKKTSSFGFKPLIFSFLTLGALGIAYLLARKFEAEGKIILPFVLILFTLTSVLAEDVNVTVGVCPPCPADYYLDVGYPTCHCAPEPLAMRVAIGLLPFLTAVGIVLWSAKAFLSSPTNPERWTSIIISITVAITLLSVLIASI